MSTPGPQAPEDGGEGVDGTGRIHGGEPVDETDEDAGAIGIFPSWGWVYGSVIVYVIVAIVILHVVTVTLDYGLE